MTTTFLHSLTMARKLALLIFSSLLGVVVLTVVFLVSERELVLDERKSNVRQAVETAYGTLTHFHGLAQSGRMTQAQAQAGALAALRGMRYGGNEYFWVNDMGPVMVMHPIKPELEKKNLSENTDPDGKHLFVEFVNTVKASGEGAVDYKWPKPGSDEPVQKVSFVKGFAPWGWILGSGVYIDTVEQTIRQRTIRFSLAAATLALVLLVLGVAIRRSLLGQVGGEPAYAADVARRIAGGDLGGEIAFQGRSGASLLSAISTMRDDLAAIVGEVRSGTDAIATASDQIAAGNLDLSARTEQQASSLEETAASVEELTGTVTQNADNASQANQLALNASDVAQRGGLVVAQVVDTMASINDSSRKIVDIISVIDGIAFQTNILALNAAVEAARAGEQGRGFAVVASEVRNLAQRSAAAAKEIKTLINDSVDKVEAGNKLVAAAGGTMDEVVASVQRVTGIMAEITSATREQSSGIAQVNQAIAQMDAATQQNAALVEQAAAAAESMRRQALRLAQAVSVFQLDSSAPARPASKPQRALAHRA